MKANPGLNTYPMRLAVQIKRLFQGTLAQSKFTRYIESIQYLPREELKRLQNIELSKILMHAVNKVPYYKSLKGQLELSPMSAADDIKHFVYRIVVRNFLIKKIFSWLPLSIRKAIANKIRKMSQNYTASLSKNARGVDQKAIERIMRKYNVNLLIHGHTHQAGDYQFKLGGSVMRRVVLDEWNKHHGSVLICQLNEDDQSLDLQFMEFK